MINSFDNNGLAELASSLRRNFALPATDQNITADASGPGTVTIKPVVTGKPKMGNADATAAYEQVALEDLTSKWGQLRIVAGTYNDIGSVLTALHTYNGVQLTEADLVPLVFPLNLTDSSITLELVAAATSLRFTGSTSARVFTPPAARLRYDVTVPALAAGKKVNLGFVKSTPSPQPTQFDVYFGGVLYPVDYTVTVYGTWQVSITLADAVPAGTVEIYVISSIPFGTGTLRSSGTGEPTQVSGGSYPISTIYEITQDGIVDTTLGFIDPVQQSGAIWIEAEAFQKNRTPIDISSLFANKNVMEITNGLFDNQTITNATRAFQGSRVMNLHADAFAKATLSGNWSSAFRNSGLIEMEEGCMPVSSEITNMSNMFSECLDLTTLSSDIVRHAGATCTDFSNLFYRCGKLITLPSGLLAGCSNVRNMTNLLAYSGVTDIPADLLVDCVGLTAGNGMFSGTKVTTIPEELFFMCGNVTTLDSVFSASSVTTIPVKLFSKLPALTSMSYAFMNCASLVDVPSDIFANNPEITTLASAFYGTRNVNPFPVGILKGLTKLTNLRSAFELCGSNSRLTNAVTFTKDIMADCGNVTDAGRTFLGGPFDVVEQGALDTLTKVTTLAYFFGGPSWSATGAPLTTVPEDLFAKCAQLIEIAGFFASTGLTTLPPTLFTKIPKRSQVKSLADMFYGCNGLTELPAGTFDGFTGVTDISSMFCYASQIRDLPDGFFLPIASSAQLAEKTFSRSGLRILRSSYLGNCTALTSVVSICENCLSLTEVEAGALGTSTKLYNITKAFSGATSLTTVADGPLVQSDMINYGQNIFAGCSKLETIYPSWLSVPTTIGQIDGAFMRTGAKSAPKGLLVGKSRIINLAKLFSECTKLEKIEAGWYEPQSDTGTTNMTSAFEKVAPGVVLEDGSFPLGKGVNVTTLFAIGTLTSPATGSSGIGGDIGRFENAFTIPAGEKPSSFVNMFATATGNYANGTLTGKARVLLTNLGLEQSDMTTVFRANANITWE